MPEQQRRRIVMLPDHMVERLDAIAQKNGLSRSQVIRLAVSRFLNAEESKLDPSPSKSERSELTFL